MSLVRRDPVVATTARNAGLLLASYLAGAFPTAELVTRAVGRDVHHEGSGNPGATNTYRIAGPAAAAVVVAVDVAKGAVTTTLGRQLGDGTLGAGCGVAAVLGHCFPPNDLAGGGKGVATTGGMLLALDPLLALLVSGGWGLLAKTTRRASLASVTVAATLPLAAAALGRPRSERLALATVSAVIVVRHRDNIARLRQGKEGLLGRTTRP
ncbi:MAG: acyl phosphate:glycerol-3-phosphate acyltransferase [Acidimicrobiaceae bacterium]|jgi:glycerol-3-phosphate acyltransferase PlsY|nr:acyl phosphate:glycerol-3-phosphate acyltransferase [Acidimicrobiaceae bacterium]